MRSLIILLVVLLTLQAAALPYKEQIALVNSLQVGRNQDPMTWACAGCDQTNKPIRTHIIEENVEEVKAILSVYEEYTVLAFRYTATLKNLWYDLLWAIQVQDQHAPQGCKVQKQYDNMWNSIKNDTFDDLIASAHTGRLIITGISLGGGLSLISYVDIQEKKIFDNIEIITFGSPKVGNKNWAKWIEKIVEPDPYHICLEGDPVCVLPKCLTPLCNYKHTGLGFQCNKYSKVCKATGRKDFEWTKEQYVSALQSGLEDYKEEDHDDEKIGNIVDIILGVYDHIINYKTIKDFDWVE